MQLSARADFLEVRDSASIAQIVVGQRPGQEAMILLRHLFDDSIIALLSDLTANIDRPGIHRIAQTFGGIPTNNHRPLLHHESGHVARITADDNKPSLLADTCTCSGMAAHDHGPSTDRSSGKACGVALDDDLAGEHAFAHPPSAIPLDVKARSIIHAAAVVAGASLDHNFDR